MDISHLLTRLQTLTNSLAIFEGQYNDPGSDIDDKCIDLFTKLVAVKESMNTLRETLRKMKEELQISADKYEELEELKQIIHHMKSNVPMKLNRVVLETNEIRSAHDLGSPVPSSWDNMDSPVRAKTQVTVAAKKPVTKSVFPVIEYISDAEFGTVPKYMKGRLNAASINKLIESFNEVFKKKYEIVKQPKKSVKAKDLDFYLDWKREENTEPKGTFFITIKDLNTFGNTKLDKAAYNMITILRHLKRIRETRQANGPQHFIAI